MDPVFPMKNGPARPRMSFNGSGSSSSNTNKPSPSYIAAATAIPVVDSEDGDSENKYAPKRHKHRLRRKQAQKLNKSVRHSVPHIVGLMLLFTSILVLWHYAIRSIGKRRHHLDLEARHQRAKLILEERMEALPHHNNDNKQKQNMPTLLNIHEEARTRTERLQGKHQKLAEAYQNVGKKIQPDLSSKLDTVLTMWLEQLDADIHGNVHGGIRWIRPYLLPPLQKNDQDDTNRLRGKAVSPFEKRKDRARFLKVRRKNSDQRMAWEEEWQEIKKKNGADDSNIPGPIVDYTDRNKYIYPSNIVHEPPPPNEYPPLQPLRKLMKDWPQDQDYTGTITETLMHFNFSNPVELQAAKRFRDAKVPFKLYDVPELLAANKKWTDEYVAKNFQSRLFGFDWGRNKNDKDAGPPAEGTAQESPNNYFAFFTSKHWNINQHGLPPTRNSDWDFAKWAEHARYADAVRLSYDQPHFYWQSGVDREERLKDYSEWTFISRDLPSFSSPEETFFVFHPEEQKGIQCRFGERGVVAATHYDGGRNCVGMITGAKRYILSPPRECSKLGIFASRKSPIYRHSLLNFAHINHLDAHDDEIIKGMSNEEREWLQRAGEADSVETVLKAGEVLFIPSHWFHYIISLQKSAQCNVRSGIDWDGTPEHGNRESVTTCRA